MKLLSFLSFLLFQRVMIILWCFYGLLGPLGGLWGLFWEAFGGHLGSLGVVLGEVWARPCEFLRLLGRQGAQGAPKSLKSRGGGR